MKKNYISPVTESIVLSTQAIMNNTSITYDGNAPAPETGGEAGEGEGSDSRRRRTVWDDEEEDDEYGY